MPFRQQVRGAPGLHGSTNGELRIVSHGRTTAHRDRVEIRAQPVSSLAGRARRDPSRSRPGIGNRAVQRQGELEGDPGPFGIGKPVEKGCVLVARGLYLYATLHLQPRSPQYPGAAARLGIGIGSGKHHPSNTSRKDRFRTGRRFPVVGTRFQRHIQGSASGWATCIPKRMDLCVRTAMLRMPPLADDLFAVGDHSTHQGIGCDTSPAPQRKLECPPHMYDVDAGGHRDKRTPKLPNQVPASGSNWLRALPKSASPAPPSIQPASMARATKGSESTPFAKADQRLLRSSNPEARKNLGSPGARKPIPRSLVHRSYPTPAARPRSSRRLLATARRLVFSRSKAISAGSPAAGWTHEPCSKV
ncbi:MAG: hypothetical protein AVDCRST_MAG89-954 [uncultured Gemmatimonadetes bacterium]|uniref:Uncharacterized protein n=1 Tax=uncultured Gemmatimonadota bacterium TaxID=203437 RepID=A0A6J4KK96_9BACT|nr:MAG: hypothetical protein AVDCRST_MAG89-954 [uncultured Gemmatimonadota bacterium]